MKRKQQAKKESAFVKNARKRLRKLEAKTGARLNHKQVKAMRVSTIGPWLRFLIVAFGLALLVGSFFVTSGAFAIGLVGFLILMVGLCGFRKTVESIANVVGEALVDTILEGIFSG